MTITGVVVDGREAIIPLTVMGLGEHSIEINAVIDTGFTGHLTLNAGLARELDLTLLGSRYVTLANGSTVALDVYRATVLWDGEKRPVRAFATEGASLIGMALLYGSELRIQATDGGEVLIRTLT
ncbi:hypothetical protein BH23ACT11_BH23ACT11_28980 [soil metagenome]